MQTMIMSISSDRFKEKYKIRKGIIISKIRAVQGQDKIKTGLEIVHLKKEMSVKESSIMKVETEYIMLKEIETTIGIICVSKLHL